MSLENNEQYYIKDEELLLLLAGAGLESWYGIPLWEGRDEREAAVTYGIDETGVYGDSFLSTFDEERVNRILSRLYQKKYIDWGKEEIEVLEPAASLVRTIRDAGECVRLEYTDENTPMQLFYLLGSGCTMIEESPWDRQTFRFSFCSLKELEEYMSMHMDNLKKTLKIMLAGGIQ